MGETVMSTEQADYSVAQKVIHWLMALIICFDLFVAQKFGRVMEDWDRLESRVDHATVGTVLTILLVLRLYFRFRHGPAVMPPGMPPWQVTAAKAGHFALYACMVLLVVSGFATGMNAADPIPLFGQLDITLGQTNEDLMQTIRPVHEFATNAMIVLIAIHVLAALQHHFVAKDRSTAKMLKFWKSERNSAG